MKRHKRSLDHPENEASAEYKRSDRRREYREPERRDDSSCRKRPRHKETHTVDNYAHTGSSGGTGRRDGESSPKKFQRNHPSSSDRVKSDGGHYDVKHRRTSTCTYPSNDKCRKDTPDNERSSHDRLDYSEYPQILDQKYGGQTRERDQHTSSDKISSKLAQEGRKERSYCDRSPGSSRRRSQLPVGGATSPRKRREVVPYASSEASSREHRCSVVKKEEGTIEMPSIVGSIFVPSLPEKFYSPKSSQVFNSL